MLLLLALACAHPVPPLLLPATPASGGAHSYLQSLSVRAGSAPWTSSDPRITCTTLGDILGVEIKIAGPDDWPYELPEEVTCSTPDRSVRVKVGFGAVVPAPWVAGDGTLVLPHRAHEWIAGVAPVPSTDVVSAEVVPAVAGVTCSAEAGRLRYALTDEAAAPPGVTRATCHVVHGDGRAEDLPLAWPTWGDPPPRR